MNDSELHDEALAELGCILIPGLCVVLIAAIYAMAMALWLASRGSLLLAFRDVVGLALIIIIWRVARSREEAE